MTFGSQRSSGLQTALLVVLSRCVWGGFFAVFPRKKKDFQHHFLLNHCKQLFVSMYFKVNYCTDKEQHSKPSKNVSSPQVSPIQPLIFILHLQHRCRFVGKLKKNKVMPCISEVPDETETTPSYSIYHPANIALLITSRIEQQNLLP